MKKIIKLMIIVMVMMTGVELSYGQTSIYGYQAPPTKLAQYVADYYKTLEGKWQFESIVYGQKLVYQIEVFKKTGTYGDYGLRIIQPQQALYDFGTNEVDLNDDIDLYHEGDGNRVSLIRTYLGNITLFKNNQADVRTSFQMALMPQFDANGNFSKLNLVTLVEEWKKSTNQTRKIPIDANVMVRLVSTKLPTAMQSVQTSKNYANYKIDGYFTEKNGNIKDWKSIISKPTQSIQANRPIIGNINIKPKPLPQSASYNITNVKFETLHVDNDLDCNGKDGEYFNGKSEFLGGISLKVYKNASLLNDDLGYIFSRNFKGNTGSAYTLELNKPILSTENYKTSFQVAPSDFNQTRLAFFGSLIEINGMRDSETSCDLQIEYLLGSNNSKSSKYLFLKDLSEGQNYIDLKGSKNTMRIHFTIKPN